MSDEFDTIEVPDIPEEDLVEQPEKEEPGKEEPGKEEPKKAEPGEEAREPEKEEPKKPTLEEMEYSRSVQKRINKATRAQREAEERAAAAEAKLELMEKSRQDMHTGSLEQREKDLVEQRKRAVEEGDLALVTQISDELTDVRIKRVQPPDPIQDPEPKKPEKDLEEEEEPDEIHPAAKDWLSRNLWYHDPAYSELAQKAERLEKELLAKGIPIGTHLYKTLDEQLLAEPDTPNHISSPSRGGEPPNRPTPGKLTDYDKSTMRRFGLDPNDPKHRASYLKRKGAAR